MTSIYFLIDKSGSMFNRIDDVLKGFNDFVKEQRDVQDSRLSLYTFNDLFSTIFEDVDIRKVTDLTRLDFRPAGTTALLDAMVCVLHKIPSTDNGRKRVFIVLTDGEENSSRLYTRQDVQDLIKNHKSLEVIFLGSNQDAILNGTTMGSQERTCLQYDDDCLYSAMRATSQAVHRYSANIDQEIEFTQIERETSASSSFIPIASP